MAVLDFKCGDCGEKFFELVNSQNRDKLQCPKCKSKNVVQVYEGKCNSGGAANGGGCSSGNCGGCSGCH